MISFQPGKTGKRKTLQNIVRSAMSDHSIKHVCHITSGVGVAPLTKEHGFSWAEVSWES